MKEIFFVGGLPRSGSTLLMNLLAQNENVFCTPTSGLPNLLNNIKVSWSSILEHRADKNASADATIALAVNFSSTGEKLTKSSVLAQKKKYIPIDANNLNITKERVDKIVACLNAVGATSLNIAGNGIHTIKGKYTQQQIDDFTYDLLNQVLSSPNLKTKIQSIRSGGQTGFDEAGAKAGIRLGLPTLVLAPKGWTFRDKTGKDISDEQQFKNRFVDSSAKNISIAAKGKMTYVYGKNKRTDIASRTTFDAIKNGERTATTRFESDGHIDYWKKLKQGDIIEWQSATGEKILVEVTKPLHKLADSGKTAQEWSRLEGWSIDFYDTKVKPQIDTAWQIEYKLLQSEPVSKSQSNLLDLYGISPEIVSE